jgi:PAS domain S-box-containing protein
MILDEEHYRKIIGLLRDAQKGLTIEEISKTTKLSRVTTTKYLNSLFVSGQVNMRKTGPAKLYSLSTRLPAEQILSQSSDPILILDESYTIREVSDSFLLAFGISKDDLTNLNVTRTVIGPGLIDRIRDPVRQAMAGKESVVNAWIPVQKEWRAFRIRIIPLVFGWGDKGIVVMLEDRTEEIMAQEENALLADLLNTSPAAITVHDFEGNFLYSNKENLELHGYSAGEFLKLNLNDIGIPDSAKRIAKHMKEIKKTGEASFEVVHSRKDGRHIPLEVHAKVATWGDRDVILSIATDISERKRAEGALRESERRFADIIGFLPDATLVVNREGTVIAWNRAIEEMTGVIAGDIVGKGDHAYGIAIYGKQRPTLLDLIFHDDPEVRMHYRHLRKKGSTFTAETVLISAGGGNRVLWLKASPFYDRDGRITGAIESIRDVTEWRRLEEELRHNYDLLSQKEQVLRESEEKLRTIFKNSPYPIAITSLPDNKFIEVNPAFLKVGGYTEEEILGKDPVELGLLSLTEVVRLISFRILKGKIENVPLALTAKEGRRVHVLFSTIPVTINNKPANMTVTAEVTKLKRIEEELLQKNEDLNRACEELTATEEELRQNYDDLNKKERVLRESEEKFRALVEHSLDGILITDITGKLLFTNRAAGLIVDAPDYEAMIGKRNVMEFIAPESQPDILRDFSKVAQGVDAYLVFYKLITETKREVWVECIGKKIPFQESEAILLSFRDVTERKKAEEELRESERKFSTLFESNPVTLTVVSVANGVFVSVNAAFLRNTGYERTEVIGKTAEEMELFVDSDAYAQMVSLLRSQHNVHGMELRCRIKNGTIRTCLFSSNVITMSGKPHILSTVEDITEHKAAESAFQAMVTSMVGTTGMESLDRITESIGAWLGADCVMIGEITPDRERVQVLSMLLDGKKIPDFSYTLKGTPCEDTAEKGFCIYPDDVARLFPESRDLREFNIRGYAGTPLRNFEGQVKGILCIMTRNPLNLPPSAREIINIIAVKAAAEIGFKNARETLHENER